MAPDADQPGGAPGGDVVWRRAFAIGAVVAVGAAALLILTIARTSMPAPGVARGYTVPFVPPRTSFEVLLLRADAQAYATLALDPTLESPDQFVTGSTSAPHFARRPVLPALLWVGSAGQREHLDVAAVVVNSVSIGLLVAAAAALVQSRGRGQDDRLAVLVVLVPAVTMQFINVGVEALGLALALIGLVLWTRPHPRLVLAAALFVAATLTRETMVIVPAVIGIDALVRRTLTVRRAALLAAAPVGYALWAAVVALRYHGMGENESINVPVRGFLDALRFWDTGDWAVFAVLALVSVLAVWRDPRSILAALIGAYWVFSVALTYRVWMDWADFARVLMPVGVVSVVLLLPSGADRRGRRSERSPPDGRASFAAGGLRSSDERP